MAGWHASSLHYWTFLVRYWIFRHFSGLAHGLWAMDPSCALAPGWFGLDAVGVISQSFSGVQGVVGMLFSIELIVFGSIFSVLK